MRKLIPILILLVFVPNFIEAKKLVRLFGGTSLSSFYDKSDIGPPHFDFSYPLKPSYVFGLQLKSISSHKLNYSIGMDMLSKRSGMKGSYGGLGGTINRDYIYNLSSINLRILAEFKSIVDKNIRLNFGPYMGYITDSKVKGNWSCYMADGNSGSGKTDGNGNDDFGGIDYGICGSVLKIYHISEALLLIPELSISVGLKNISKNSIQSSANHMNIVSLFFTLGIAFNNTKSD